jgi:nicotinamidase-related amidase
MLSRKVKQGYAAAGFNRKLGFGNTPALLVVDFVGAYLIKGSPLYAGVERARDNAARLLDTARRARIPIAHTCVSYAPDGADGGVFFRKVAALKVFAQGADPALQAFDPALTPKPGEIVVVKQYASAFFGTSLASTFRTLGVDTILIAGVSTSGCIRASALDACQNGFIPVVVADAVGDRDRKIHESNLFDLDAKYADVVPLSAACQFLRKWKRIGADGRRAGKRP